MNKIYTSKSEKYISHNNNSNNKDDLSNNKSGYIFFNKSSGLRSDYNNNDNINKKKINSIGYKFPGKAVKIKKEKRIFILITLSKDLIHFSNEEIRLNDYKILNKNLPLNKIENENKIFCDKIALNNGIFKINENLDDKSNNTGLFGKFSNLNNNKNYNKINIFSYINKKNKNYKYLYNNKKKSNI